MCGLTYWQASEGILNKELDLSLPWESFDIAHELTTRAFKICSGLPERTETIGIELEERNVFTSALRGHASRLYQWPIDLLAQKTFMEPAKGVLNQLLAGQRPGIQDLARELHLSTRTLQRRLTEQGITF
jgi:hypothetical protein